MRIDPPFTEPEEAAQPDGEGEILGVAIEPAWGDGEALGCFLHRQQPVGGWPAVYPGHHRPEFRYLLNQPLQWGCALRLMRLRGVHAGPLCA